MQEYEILKKVISFCNKKVISDDDDDNGDGDNEERKV